MPEIKCKECGKPVPIACISCKSRFCDPALEL